MMIQYPKIETVWKRDKTTFKVISDEYRLPEFTIPSTWLAFEKIDGTNIRVGWDGAAITIGGRTDRAQLHKNLVANLHTMFPAEKMGEVFLDMGITSQGAILFGEGCGPGIQKGGGDYAEKKTFILFDVWIDGWWLNWASVMDIAQKLDVDTVPFLGRICDIPRSAEELRVFVPKSLAALGGTGCTRSAEGIVARTDPLLMLRDGKRRLTWKLKFKDFQCGRR